MVQYQYDGRHISASGQQRRPGPAEVLTDVLYKRTHAFSTLQLSAVKATRTTTLGQNKVHLTKSDQPSELTLLRHSPRTCCVTRHFSPPPTRRRVVNGPTHGEGTQRVNGPTHGEGIQRVRKPPPPPSHPSALNHTPLCRRSCGNSAPYPREHVVNEGSFGNCQACETSLPSRSVPGTTRASYRLCTF